MEKRDPLREVNTSSKNEPQDAVDNTAKQPDPVAGSSSDNKENGYGRQVQTSDTDKSDIGCGSSNKPKETKPRRSILKTFDPLYSESPEQFQAVSSKPYQGPREQFIIEDSDESESAQTHSAEVSDDDTTFVDACTDETAGGIKVPENKNLQLEESLLKFYTPEKVYVSGQGSNSESASTSDVAENKSVLTDIESTSFSDQSHIENATICLTSPAPHITESEIVSAISKKLSSDYIIPTRSKFTISECELENYNILKETFSAENRQAVFRADERNTSDIVTDSITSVNETRNISPETSTVALESGPRNDESIAGEHYIEHRTLDVAETVEKEESSDDSQESKITVIEQIFLVEDNLEEKEKHFPGTTKEKADCTIPEIVLESSAEEPSILKETDSSGNLSSTVDNETEISNNIRCEEVLKKCQTSEELPTPEFERIDKHTEKEETFEQQLEVQSEKEKPEFLKQLHIEHESNLKDKETENQESSLETHEKSRESLKLDCDIDFTSECQTPQEPNYKTNVEQEEIHETSQQLESDYKTESEINHTFLKSDSESESEFKEKPEKHLKHLELDCEVPSQDRTEIPEVEETTECTELRIINNDGEEIYPEKESLPIPDERISEEKPEELEDNTSVPIPDERISEEKSEELEDNTSKINKSSDVNPETVTESNDTTYVHHDEEHHLDSGLDSIEDSFTKSPKSQVGDSEDSDKGEGEDQAISPDKEDSCLPEEKLGSSNNELKIISVGETTFNEDTIIAVDATAQDQQQPQLLDQLADAKIEEKPKLEVEESTKPEIDGTISNLTDNQKSDISSADIGPLKAKMADLSEKLNEQQQENSDLKLQLNAIQQAKASLELEIRQKEEVIIKTQAEALKNEQTYKQEIKQLREKLKENSKLIEKDGSKELEDQLKEAKVREAKVVAELNQRTKDDLNYQKIMEEYENAIATRFADYQKLKEEHETATRHLANIELAFSDVHQKYERTKALLEGFKSNEEALNVALQTCERTCKQHEERYESLKAHAKGQIEKSNKEILMLRDKYEMDINKLKAIIKRLEIKCSSLEVSLQQKSEECAALSALCDEVTGKKV